MTDRGVLLDLAMQFAFLSIMAFGGIIAVVPEMHVAVVEQRHWMSSELFVTLFALAQAAPGPNVIVVTLVGWQVAGGAGALVATVAVSAPSFILAYTASRLWSWINALNWYRLFERGIAPVTIGLVLSTGLLLADVAGRSWTGIAVTVLTVAATLRWQNSPLIVLGCAALAGLAGFV
jgi:chromate transporter